MRTAKPWTLPSQPASHARLLASGVSSDMISTRIRAGALLRLRHGVYLAASAWPAEVPEQHRVLAHAEVVANPDAVLSHQSAALAWGLPSPSPGGWEGEPVAVTLPPGRSNRQSGAAVHHVASLPNAHLGRDADGYPATNLQRTAVDLAAGLDLPNSMVILDAAARALCAGYVTEPRRSDFSNPRLVRTAGEQLAEVARARRRTGLLAGIALADPSRESAAESLSAAHFVLAGLPRPECQVRIATSRGTFYPDFLWRGWRVIGECDGAVKYSDARAVEQERARQEILEGLEYTVVRWLAKEIMFHPEVVVDRVARKLAASPFAR